MYILVIFIGIGIFLGCIIAHNEWGYFEDYVAYSSICSILMIVLLVGILIFSPMHSKYNYHTVYANDIKATIKVMAKQDDKDNTVTLIGGDDLSGITAKTIRSNDYTGTITASKGKTQSTRDFERLIVKGSDNGTRVTKIEYGTETKYLTLFGLIDFDVMPIKYKTAWVTLSASKEMDDLSNLLDGKK